MRIIAKSKGRESLHSSGGGVLGDGLGTLRDGVLSELTGEEESDGGLDFAGGESVLLVISDKLGGLRGELLEDVGNEGVHDAHGSLGDTSLGVDLLEDSVDVDGESLLSSSLLGGGSLLDDLLLGGSTFSGTGGFLGGHFVVKCFCFNLILNEPPPLI